MTWETDPLSHKGWAATRQPSPRHHHQCYRYHEHHHHITTIIKTTTTINDTTTTTIIIIPRPPTGIATHRSGRTPAGRGPGSSAGPARPAKVGSTRHTDRCVWQAQTDQKGVGGGEWGRSGWDGWGRAWEAPGAGRG